MFVFTIISCSVGFCVNARSRIILTPKVSISYGNLVDVLCVHSHLAFISENIAMLSVKCLPCARFDVGCSQLTQTTVCGLALNNESRDLQVG
jgi:hypothetical protein